tara:strand:+ start:19640 stop:19912 length:273 start_codon:yes stop_codon:yes gene_type:complete
MIKFQHAWGKLRCKTAQLRFIDGQSLIVFETFDPSFGFLINQFQTRGKTGRFIYPFACRHRPRSGPRYHQGKGNCRNLCCFDIFLPIKAP